MPKFNDLDLKKVQQQQLNVKNYEEIILIFL